MIIGTLTKTSLWCRVSRDHKGLISYLIEEGRGPGHWEASLVSRITLLFEHYRWSLAIAHPSN